jgi:hypothetical protein
LGISRETGRRQPVLRKGCENAAISPAGIGVQHFVKKDIFLEYRIRIQEKVGAQQPVAHETSSCHKKAEEMPMLLTLNQAVCSKPEIESHFGLMLSIANNEFGSQIIGNAGKMLSATCGGIAGRS